MKSTAVRNVGFVSAFVLVLVVTAALVSLVIGKALPAHHHESIARTPRDTVSQPAVIQSPTPAPTVPGLTENFGPFVGLKFVRGTEPDTHKPAVLMLGANGQINVSTQWSIPVPDGWMKYPSFDQVYTRSSLTTTGYVTFQIDETRTFTLPCGVAFFLDEEPQVAYAFDCRNGMALMLMADKAKHMRHRLPASSSN